MNEVKILSFVLVIHDYAYNIELVPK